MTCHYPDLGSAADWYIKASFPLDLGNDMSSVWNFCARHSDFISLENSGGIAKCQLISGYSSPCQHLSSVVLFFTVNSSSRCNLLLYNISLILHFLSCILKMLFEYPFMSYIFVNIGSLLTLSLIYQMGLTENIDDVIKEYKETRGLLV